MSGAVGDLEISMCVWGVHVRVCACVCECGCVGAGVFGGRGGGGGGGCLATAAGRLEGSESGLGPGPESRDKPMLIPAGHRVQTRRTKDQLRRTAHGESAVTRFQVIGHARMARSTWHATWACRCSVLARGRASCVQLASRQGVVYGL